MKKNIAIKVENVSKYYKIYNRARDRVKEAFSLTRKKYYKKFCAIENVNLEIKKGEVLGIFGLNGAGKSTLLKMIAGVVTPSKGRIHVNGHINAMLELTGSLNPELTGRQNIKFSLELNNIADEDKEKITKEIIDFAEIGPHIDQPVKNYSSGMGARLGFGMATAIKPEILIVDEVLAVGDSIFQNKCFIRIRELLKGGTTVIFVSHNIALMIEFCSRAILLYDRNIILDGPVREIAHFYQRLLFSDNKSNVISQASKINSNNDSDKNIEDTDNSNDIVRWDNENIKLIDLTIYDQQGHETSFLETGCDYILEFKILFKNAFDKIELVFDASNITGKKITLLDSSSEKNIIEGITKNETYHIKNIFKCTVYDGQYYIKMGVNDISDKRYTSALESSNIEIKFEAGVIRKENILSITKA